MNCFKWVFVLILFHSLWGISQDRGKDTVVFVKSCVAPRFSIYKTRSLTDPSKIINQIYFCDSVYEINRGSFYGIYISPTGIKSFEAEFDEILGDGSLYLNGSFISYDELGRKIREGSTREVITQRFRTTSYYSYYDKDIREYSYLNDEDTLGYLAKEIIVNAYKRKYLINEYSVDGVLIRTYKERKKCGFLCSFRRSFGF